ncbi:MAG TPA: 1-deoxy-D-xylulose-5-phosphate synthase [Epulopiscium sp.]|nr:1-deoxy-D-xylulose-5-phosphate synthase [Candidatus Epulonipiscium sp.]
MGNLLTTILSPKDIKKLNNQQLTILGSEIRSFLIKALSQTGGHLASNLGVVELTLALHCCFDTPKDKIIWDVGHQSYVHKILTGRQGGFKTLRKSNGMSGFPKPDESKHDAFGTGHSSTSISVALGMATARDLKGANNSVIAVIGDGSMTGGMSFEALNHAGRGNTNLIVILNDNEMSISQNVGGLSKYLNKIRTDQNYLGAKRGIEKVLHKIPLVGGAMVQVVRKTKEGIRTLLVPGELFEELGFTYIGPVDGHNMRELLQVLGKAKKMKGPILIHVKTTKGKGYCFAEDEPEKYHGVSPFVPATGNSIPAPVSPKAPNNYSSTFGQSLIQLARKDKKLVAITAAMPEGTGLNIFAKVFPSRFIDVGIAEQHAVTFAAGLAAEGYKPVVAIYSTFLQRAYDQIIHDVCIPNLPVILAIDRGGIVGEDGATHQGVFDLSFLSHIPNMSIMAPKNYAELKYMLEFATTYKGPMAIRYPRGSEGKRVALIDTPSIEYGKSEVLESGKEVAIIAVGKMVEVALGAASLLKGKGLTPYVINARFVKPIDQDTLANIASNITDIITIEDNMISSGFGENLTITLSKSKKFNHINIHNLGFPDEFIEHGLVDDLYKKYGLDKQSIADTIYTQIHKKN